MALYYIASERVIKDVPDHEIAHVREKSPTYAVLTLDTYDTPYYYAARFGRQNHYRTIAALQRYIQRKERRMS